MSTVCRFFIFGKLFFWCNAHILSWLFVQFVYGYFLPEIRFINILLINHLFKSSCPMIHLFSSILSHIPHNTGVIFLQNC